ncbi:MAG: UDP-N-acetylmuramoyl-L-alanine--D-glutamate ligase, partial [Acidobacteria bacterium]|nr:UDP-N-acetylmuramoyl-L-alanine--D-glutamate ligase [Acidobacteriota bacterium]
MFDLSGKKILVIGLARTGVATSLFCARHGAQVTTVDTRAESELTEPAAKLRAAGISLQLGGYSGKILDDQELVIPSPGVPADSEILKAARAQNIPVWSEIELADRFLNGRLIGITGSNGKTTTTSLIEHILKNSGFNTLLAGNIGTPLIDVVEKTTDQTVTVAELSSFQLELIETF